MGFKKMTGYLTEIRESVPYLLEGGIGFYLAAIVVFFAISFFKGAFGGGLGLLCVPIMGLFISAPEAAAISAPMFCIMDAFAIRKYPTSTWDKRNLLILLPAVAAGIGVGALLLGGLNEHAITLLVAAIALIFSSKWLLEQWAGRERPTPKNAGVVRGLFWGGLSGFTSVLAHSGGPPVAIYLLSQRLEKSILAGTQVIFFTFGNFLKLMPYLFLGFISPKTAIASLIIAPTVPIGIHIGKRYHDTLDQTVVYFVCYTVIFLVGLKLAWDGIQGFL